MSKDFLLSSYQYNLPPKLIAQTPSDKREKSRLLILERDTGKLTHLYFKDVANFLEPGDCLVINQTKVFPARILGRKPTGGKIEFLFLEFPKEIKDGVATAKALCKSSKPVKVGDSFSFMDLLEVVVTKRHKNGGLDVTLYYEGELLPIIEQVGIMPLPPYIKREKMMALDKERYQTVYAKEVGSVAAPTAGLHFTKEIMNTLIQKGVKIAPLTLHVGYGTFAPIRTDDIRRHKIHSEWIEIGEESARIIQETKQTGKKVVAVGTTSVRTIEFVYLKKGLVTEYSGLCDLYIYPGFKFSVTDAMLTNFHLPGSSLLLLVSAFAGREKILSTYMEAIDKGYRFFSYGDAMLIL